MKGICEFSVLFHHFSLSQKLIQNEVFKNVILNEYTRIVNGTSQTTPEEGNYLKHIYTDRQMYSSKSQLKHQTPASQHSMKGISIAGHAILGFLADLAILVGVRC